jgi:pimeloyl-ACP methyl ester carboxylesterase
MTQIGCAVDAWRLSRRSFPEHAWRSDRRMRRVTAGGHVFRILDHAGDGRPILFAADAPVVLEHYAPVIDRLARGRRAIALELPGFGFSTPSRDYRFTLAEQVAALAALIDELELQRVTLAFTCVNAMAALAFAHHHPARVEKLVLAQMPSAEEMSRWASHIDVKLLGRGLFVTPLLGQALMWAAPSQVAERWFRFAVPGRGFADASRAVYHQGGAFCLAALMQSLRGISAGEIGIPGVPTTIVWGDADRTHRKTDKESSRLWNAEVVHFPDATHCPDLEQPDAFAALL